jgi:short/branched chain acyl-CoA dehydrogenase
MGSEEQAQKFLQPLMSGPGAVTALSTTEPDGGVTSALMIDPENFVFITKAEPDGNEWVINGTKSYCSNAGLPFAKWALVFCRVDMNKTGWPSTMPIVVPMDTPGVFLPKEEDKMGQRLSNTQSMTFENVRVPKDYAIGAGGRPIVGGSRVVTYEHDTAIAAISIGCARAAYKEAVA